MAETQAVPAREYETIYVLRPDITKEGADKVSSRVAEVMQREGGTLTQVENWGRRALAFPVWKYRRAYYVYLKYLGTGQVVSELERNFRMLDGVLKYQTVKLRDEVDVGSVKVNPEDVEFEAIEPPLEEEPEENLAEQLGLHDMPLRERAPRVMAEVESEVEVASDEEGEVGESVQSPEDSKEDAQ